MTIHTYIKCLAVAASLSIALGGRAQDVTLLKPGVFLDSLGHDRRWRSEWRPVPKGYQRFVRENKKIVYVTKYDTPVKDYIYWMHGDTLIKGASFKKLYRTIALHNKAGDGWTYVGALRERNMQVAWVPAGTTQRRYFADFSIQRKDSLIITENTGMFLLRNQVLESKHIKRRYVEMRWDYPGSYSLVGQTIARPHPLAYSWVEGAGHVGNTFEAELKGELWKCYESGRCVFFMAETKLKVYENEELRPEYLEADESARKAEEWLLERYRKRKEERDLERKRIDSLKRTQKGGIGIPVPAWYSLEP